MFFTLPALGPEVPWLSDVASSAGRVPAAATGRRDGPGKKPVSKAKTKPERKLEGLSLSLHLFFHNKKMNNTQWGHLVDHFKEKSPAVFKNRITHLKQSKTPDEEKRKSINNCLVGRRLVKRIKERVAARRRAAAPAAGERVSPSKSVYFSEEEGDDDEREPPNQYLQDRQRRIERNAEVLKSLGLGV